MKIEKQDYNNISVIGLKGELDCESAEALKNNFKEVIGAKKAGIVIDLSEVGFMDSEGLETLLWTRDYALDSNCQLRLAGLDENCTKILEVTRLENEFERYNEVSEALKSFA